MSTVTGKTADAMDDIADASVVTGAVNPTTGHLILTTHGGDDIDAGDVIGPTGATGATGATGPSGAAPTGAMVMYGASLPPTGWLLCDGSAVSRSTYASLFAVIGTTFGAGNGTTTFNVPSMDSRFPRQSTGFLGVTGGSSSHSHQIDGGTTPAYAEVSILTGSGPHVFMNRVTTPSWNSTHDVTATSAESASTSKTSGAGVFGVTSTGVGTPLYLNLTFIIKT